MNTSIIEYYLEGVNEGQQSATAWASSVCKEKVVAQHRNKKGIPALIPFYNPTSMYPKEI